MKILIAEDEPMIRELLNMILQAEGHEVISAVNGKEALALWSSHEADLICLDIMMPEIDGYSVCRKIRETNMTVPILFLSAKTEEEDVVKGLEIGANDFIRKPFGKAELLARINVASRKIGSAPDKTPTTFTLGSWEIIPDELRASNEKTNVDLSQRELSILLYFSKNLGKVITRDELLDACWGINFFPESRTLDQQISRLRKKLKDSKAELITTIRGAGYRVDPC